MEIKCRMYTPVRVYLPCRLIGPHSRRYPIRLIFSGIALFIEEQVTRLSHAKSRGAYCSFQPSLLPFFLLNRKLLSRRVSRETRVAVDSGAFIQDRASRLSIPRIVTLVPASRLVQPRESVARFGGISSRCTWTHGDRVQPVAIVRASPSRFETRGLYPRCIVTMRISIRV